MACKIEDYALIGDCETAALVARDGSIDWLCWPRFDSAACFAALLGTEEHGRWLLAPADPKARARRRYRDGTTILETEWESAGGTATVTDFMPVRAGPSHLVRIVRATRGELMFRVELILRFDYGGTVPWVTRLQDGSGLRAVAGPDMAVLRAPVPLHGENLRSVGEFMLREGEEVTFVLSHSASHEPDPPLFDPLAALSETEGFWRQWAQRCQHQGPWHEAVIRSHITLKALTYAPTGAIVAAPTTSLPERLGGSRNWDYRFCWLRDATFTLLSLMEAGYVEEAVAWREWLLRAMAGTPSRAQIMYGIGGERRLPEWEVPWLPGYEASLPVRVGNAAYGQTQLDVVGEVADALHQARSAGLGDLQTGWALERALVEHLCDVWQEPDEGIWEVRGGRRHFTHSKVMAWVALDRAIRSARTFGLAAPLEKWLRLREAVHEDVCRQGYSAERASFVQFYGSRELDASLLLIPLVGFLPPSDPRVQGTLRAIERELMVQGLVLRYDSARTPDGLPPGEGVFLACSFWFVDNLWQQGRQSEAVAMFERLLLLRNDVGLLAEEYDPVAQRQLGNFPQAFSHLALADSARNLGSTAGPAAQRAVAESETGPLQQPRTGSRRTLERSP